MAFVKIRPLIIDIINGVSNALLRSVWIEIEWILQLMIKKDKKELVCNEYSVHLTFSLPPSMILSFPKIADLSFHRNCSIDIAPQIY